MDHSRPAGHVLSLAAAAFLSLGAIGAQAECLSPSAASGEKVTTVYRCPDQQSATGAQQPAAALQEKTTVVERGPADAPWFAPKPVENSVEAAAESSAVQGGPVANSTGQTVPAETPTVQAVPAETSPEQPVPAEAPAITAAPAENAAEPPEAQQARSVKVEEKTEAKPVKKTSARKKKVVRKKLVKLKPSETKSTKALAAKAAPDEKSPKAKADTPAKSDSNTVIWTRQDMSLGKRLGNWLGL